MKVAKVVLSRKGGSEKNLPPGAPPENFQKNGRKGEGGLACHA